MESIFRLLKWVSSNYYRFMLGGGILATVVWMLAVNTQPFSDFAYYHNLAQQIAKGGEWGNTYTSVGYPIFLGFFYWLFGSSIWVAKGLNILLTIISNCLVVSILRRSNLPEGTKKIVAAIFIFFPSNIYYNSIVATEPLFNTLLLLGIYFYISNNRYRYWIIGFLTGLGTMVKPFFPAFFLVIFLTDLVINYRVPLSRNILRSALILIVCLITISPWLVRNYYSVGQLTWVSNNGGINLYINNNSQNSWGGWMPAEQVQASLVLTAQYQHANITQQNNMLMRAAKQWIISHPIQFAILGIKRELRTFLLPMDILYSFNGSYLNAVRRYLLFGTTAIFWEIVFVTGIVGLCKFTLTLPGKIIRHELEEQAKLSICLVLVFFMFAGIYFMTEGQTRYAYPTTFSVIYFSGSWLTRKFELRGRSNRTEMPKTQSPVV